MPFTLPSHETLYDALIARDPAYEGHAFVGVTTTGVFCRLTCAARKPRSENTRFFTSIPACLEAGFRPCLRCRPLDPVRMREPLVATLLDRLEREPDRNWSEDDLVAMRLEPSTVRRAFKRHLGMTFLDLARLRGLGRGMDRLAAGDRVIEAQLDAGHDSASGFRGAIAQLIGGCPSGLRGQELLKADWIETPLGAMLAVADPHALHLLEFVDRKALPAEFTRLHRDFASSDGHVVEDVGENPHVEHCIAHGVAHGVLARDDADGVERHALERGAVARAMVAPHQRRILAHGHVENPMQVVLDALRPYSTGFAGRTLTTSAQWPRDRASSRSGVQAYPSR